MGGTVPDKGTAEVPIMTKEGHQHHIRWRNAPVAMPILSTKLLAQENGEVRYQAEGGQICNFKLDQQSHFVSSSDVYFLKMYIEKRYTEPAPDVRELVSDEHGVLHVGAKADQGVGRLGAA